MVKYLFTALLLSSVITYGQDTKQDLKEAGKLAKKGHKILIDDVPDYISALPFFTEAMALDTRNPEYPFMAGICQINTRQQSPAAENFQRTIKIAPDYSKDAKYLLAMLYHLDYEFEKAKEFYKAYRESLTKEELDRKDVSRYISLYVTGQRTLDLADHVRVVNLNKIIKKRLAECDHGMKYVAEPVEAIVTNLGKTVNTSFHDYVPIITADESELYFTSRNPNTLGGELDPFDGQPYEDIYRSYFKEGRWTEPEGMRKPINTKTHDALAGLSADGLTLYIYKDENAGDLYECKMRDADWGRPRPMKEINSSWTDKSVTVSADGSMIFFTSNRKGGIGGYDMYMARLESKDRWGEPINMGPVVNTEYDEEGVFFHPDGRTLYFSSRGHSSMGGYDVFKTIMQPDSTWSEPENLGYPINTTGDDIFFVLSASGLHGYYSSHRKGGVGKNDLYRISMPLAMKIKKKDTAQTQPLNPLTLVTGFITDAVTMDNLFAEIQVVDNEKNTVVANLNSNGATGKFLVALPSGKNYGIAVKKEGYLFHSENFDIPASTDYQEIRKDVALKKIAVGSKIVLRNIFFDFGSPSLRDASLGELNRLIKLLNDVPTMKIEISGHTDNKGSAEFNKTLSGKRAAAVVAYLQSNGIDATRLSSAGFGEEKPMAPNTKEDGTDNPEGRQLNRRVEFEILEN